VQFPLEENTAGRGEQLNDTDGLPVERMGDDAKGPTDGVNPLALALPLPWATEQQRLTNDPLIGPECNGWTSMHFLMKEVAVWMVWVEAHDTFVQANTAVSDGPKEL
jgi:hypothetical protein